MKVYLPLLLLLGFYASCTRSNIYENNVAIKSFKWDEKTKHAFKFDITDTVANYNMYFTIRHSDAYPYSNIWLNIQTQFPGTDTSSQTRIEVPLADLEGKWLGRGMNEIWEHRMLIASPVKFSQTGQYTITLQHAMRINPLPEIMSVGIRVEKASNEN